MRAVPDHAGVGALAQRQLQCIDQDRFAGTGLAGQHGETRPEIQFKRFDDDEVADGQGEQHREQHEEQQCQHFARKPP